MTRGRRYYGFLMRLLPGTFRRKCGSELAATFEDMRRELGERPGLLRLGRFYGRLTVDLFKQISAERARTNEAERLIRDAMKFQPFNRVLWNTLLDIYYDRTRAEVTTPTGHAWAWPTD